MLPESSYTKFIVRDGFASCPKATPLLPITPANTMTIIRRFMRSPLILHATSVASTHHSRLLAQFATRTKYYLHFHVNVFSTTLQNAHARPLSARKRSILLAFSTPFEPPSIARGQYGHMLHQLSTATNMLLLVRAHFVHFPCRTESCTLDVSVCGVLRNLYRRTKQWHKRCRTSH